MIFRKAVESDIDQIWEVLQYAIARRKSDGSSQWQDGYPNPDAICNDLNNDWAYVIADDEGVLAYAAVIFDGEPAYDDIEGKWLSTDDYVVLHRVAAAERSKGMGIATHFFKYVEELALSQNVHSIKVDTNFDNIAMLKILDRLGYQYCGEVYFRGSARKAFEKLI
ncbi:GNAT family N-acetyltransferase [Sphingobacterium rhinopitheci]|uniref:GNAT family N-acetyltransferase n=1 Tax=Sphingobacterium rhinopitheci TaxID=2781960 RepID=UPI001F527380|nr:GNAT family N-acetyltransferase [Sphingobacterium rhinopitheci]MCI0922368.1 GNAT family N-acetyltransferase [Sphingobacterium rhinopitheci]